jgi:uncharacterized protein YneF (UPF0154 family)
LKVKANLTVDDYWNYDKFIILTKPKLILKLIISLACMPICILALGIMLKLSIVYCIVITIIGGGIFDYIYMKLMKKKMDKNLNNKKGYICEHDFEISEAGFYKKNNVYEKLFTWNCIKYVTEDLKNIYIFTGKAYAEIIPKASFVSKDEAKNFFDLALENWDKNKKI